MTTTPESSPSAPRKRPRRRLYQEAGGEATPPESSDTGTALAVIETPPPSAPDRQALAMRVVRRHMVWSAAGGLVPIPFFDAAVVSILQVRMLGELSAVYEQSFQKEKARIVVTALAGGIGSAIVSDTLVRRFFRYLPAIGPALTMASAPVLASAATYAVGKVFIKHYEMGGTLLSFDADRVRSHYAREFNEGRQLAATLKA